MELSRRDWLAGAAAAAGGLVLGDTLQAASTECEHGGLKFGMCDWTMRQRNEPAALHLGKEVGLDGVEVDMGPPESGLRLRKPQVQKAYLTAARKTGLAIPSVGVCAANIVPPVASKRMETAGARCTREGAEP